MASKTEICNLALARIGSRPISDIEEGSAESTFCKQFYDRDRRNVLRHHPWNFAVAVVNLAESIDESLYGYTYRYELPSGCLRPLELVNLASVSTASTSVNSRGEVYQLNSSIPDVPSVAYKIIGRELLTNMEDARLAYVSDVTNPNTFSETFIEALSLRIAANLASVIASNPTIQQNMLRMYQMALVEAMGIDSSENKATEVETLVSVR